MHWNNKMMMIKTNEKYTERLQKSLKSSDKLRSYRRDLVKVQI